MLKRNIHQTDHTLINLDRYELSSSKGSFLDFKTNQVLPNFSKEISGGSTKNQSTKMVDELLNVEAFEISGDGKYIATLCSNYILRVYRTYNKFKRFKELQVFEIYRNNSKGKRTKLYGSQTPSSDDGTRVFMPEYPNLASLGYISLSISYDGKYVAISASAQYRCNLTLNVYTTDEKERNKKINSLCLEPVDSTIKSYESARPVFLKSNFLVATNFYLYMFNLDFERLYSINISTEIPYVRTLDAAYGYLIDAPGILINKSIDYLEITDDMMEVIGNDNNLKKIVTRSRGENSLFLATRLIYQNILISSDDIGVLKIWSIENGNLISAIRPRQYEKIMALSENARYFATSVFRESIAHIYSADNGLKLNTIILHTKQRQEKATSDGSGGACRIEINCMDFRFNDRYIFISGYREPIKGLPVPIPLPIIKSTAAEKATSTKTMEKIIFIELWRLSDQQLVYYTEFKIFTSLLKQPIICNGKQPSDSFSVVYFFKNNREQLETKYFEISVQTNPCNPITIDNFVNKWKEWEPLKSLDSLEKPWLLIRYNNDVISILDDPFPNLRRFVLDYNDKRYILLFGKFIMQLWQLEPIKENMDIADEYLLQANMNTNTISQPQNVLYNSSIESSTLIYLQYYSDKQTHNFAETLKGIDPSTFYTSIIDITYNEKQNKMSETQNSTYENSTLKKDTAIIHQNTQVEHQNDIFTVSNKSTQRVSDSLEFNHIENTIRALCYLKSCSTENNFALNKLTLKTEILLEYLLEKYKYTKYFATESGSYSLYLLSKFPSCHKFIKSIILETDKTSKRGKKKMNKERPISIFSYSNTDIDLLGSENKAKINENISEYRPHVNILTELSVSDDCLFFVFFYHVLVHALTHGLGNMSAVTDLILFLQHNKRLDILLKCIEMMTYFPVATEQAVQMKDVENAFNKSFISKNSSDMINFSFAESLKRENHGLVKKIKIPDWFFSILKSTKNGWKQAVEILKEDSNSNHYQEPICIRDFYISDSKILCVVPFPRFNSHARSLENDMNKITSMASNFKSSDSPFTKIASSKTFNDMFIEGDVVIEALTTYKWNTFAKSRFIWILMVHAVYYISFSIGLAFAEEVFDYTSANYGSVSPSHMFTFIIMFASWFVLFIQEIRQFLNDIPAYITIYNFIDCLSLILPVASLLLLLTGNEYVNQVSSITTLMLWIHGILRFRAIHSFGTTLELIIQLSLKTMPFIGIFCAVVVAFTHTFIVLLRQRDDSYFQEQYSGTLHPSEFGNMSHSENKTEIGLNDTSDQNDFKNPFKAFSDVWFLIYGVWDPLKNGDVGDDSMVIILSILFSFIIVLIFFNMVIALMSSTIEEVKKRGKKNWIYHLAAVVSEIELFWCTPKERLDRLNNPHFVFYIANKDFSDKQKEKLNQEYEKYLRICLQDKLNQRVSPHMISVELKDHLSVNDGNNIWIIE